MIALAHFHQGRSEQWPLFEVEGRSRRLTSDSHRFSLAFEFWNMPQVQVDERQSEGSLSRMNHLHWLPLVQLESGSPDFMPPDNFTKGLFQRGHIQWAGTTNSQRFVVNRNSRRSHLAV